MPAIAGRGRRFHGQARGRQAGTPAGRPSVAIRGDYVIPEAAPLSLDHGLLAAEMGMDLQMALGQRRFLLLHASAVGGRGGRC